MAGPNATKSKKLIAEYIGKRVTAELDGTLFDHVPARFRFRFEDPATMMEEVSEGYPDELDNMECVDGDGEWCNDNLIPVAAVSSIQEDEADDEDGDDDEDGEDVYEFAWVFLDWKTSPPSIRVTTTDDWGEDRTAKSLADLGLEIG